MKIYIDKDDDSDLIVLLGTVEGDDAIGDIVKPILPGETVFGRTYEEWKDSESPFELESLS